MHDEECELHDLREKKLTATTTMRELVDSTYSVFIYLEEKNHHHQQQWRQQLQQHLTCLPVCANTTTNNFI